MVAASGNHTAARLPSYDPRISQPYPSIIAIL